MRVVIFASYYSLFKLVMCMKIDSTADLSGRSEIIVFKEIITTTIDQKIKQIRQNGMNITGRKNHKYRVHLMK